MIQDIAPHKLNNQYGQKKAPDAGSRFLYYDGRKVLVRKGIGGNESQIAYPTYEELKKCKPCYETHQVRSFAQTIPMSEDAIEVKMEIKYEKNTEGKIVVSGKTNLFDGAQLMISIIPDGKFYGPSCKVNCLNGTFTSEPLGNGKNLLGKCKMSITMPVSSAQPIEFVKKAGMQYENLKGDFIVRKGISPSGKYEQEVVL